MGLLGSILKLAALRRLRENIGKAEAGDPRAQLRLGITYAHGRNGVPQNYGEAAKWFRKAAEQGHSDAQLNLGILLAEGRGVERDLTEAYKWIYLANWGFRFGDPLSDSFFIGAKRDAATQTQGRLRALMTPDQIAEGEKLARQLVRASVNWQGADLDSLLKEERS